MKKIFIKYNPYKLKTEVTVDGKELAENSRLREKIDDGSHLQEWIEELPEILIDEYNDRDFDVTFHGTLLDFEDLTEVFTFAYEKGELTAKLDRIPAKETSDKEILIDEVFRKIQEGPFEELRSESVLDAFQKVRSKDFDICVIATMSSGKSTLINAMLGEKLMPSKQEACTAIITYVKDTLETEGWQADVYDKNDQKIESRRNLSYSDMERLNGDERVSKIKINGNIPFVSAEDVSLVLIDTPGPNNSRNPEHRRVQNEFLEKSSKSLVLYIMEGTFGSDDDNALLEKVAESMKVGGKQSKDRFIFVVNKMDGRKKEDGATEDTLKRIRDYLKKHGIANPNLFPAAALPALNIRMIEKSDKLVDEETLDETEFMVYKMNKDESKHFEKYAPLPRSVQQSINSKLEEAECAKDANTKALIHTGIVSIEAAIRQYAQKYSKTAKIKTLVDTFKGRLESSRIFEETKKKLSENEEKKEEAIEKIEIIQKKIDDGKAAEQFEGAVKNAVTDVKRKAKGVVDGLIAEYEAKLSDMTVNVQRKEVDKAEAKKLVNDFERFAKKLEPEFRQELDNMIRSNLVRTGKALIREYRKKLASLAEEIESKDSDKEPISIAPLDFMDGSIETIDDSFVEKFTRSKQIEDGREWIENTSKKWYKPWTWFQESGYYRTKYKTVEVVDASNLAQEFFSPIQDSIYEDGDAAYAQACKQSEHIVVYFNKEFKRLNDKVKEKLDEMKSCLDKKEDSEKIIDDCEKKIEWLNSIEKEVESILEI